MFQWLLEHAAGYAVYGSDGRRLGTFIELLTQSEGEADSVAIRCDGVFLWRRRSVPLAAVARVDPEERTVTLLLDETGIERAHELRPGEIRGGWVAERIDRYAETPVAEADAPASDANTSTAGPESDACKELSSADGSPSAGAAAAEEAAPGQHLLFAPTSAGYVLIECTGAPPLNPDTIELSDPVGSFVVVKLAHSPLPNDERLCAYLDRLE
jgi:hypothetical protein